MTGEIILAEGRAEELAERLAKHSNSESPPTDDLLLEAAAALRKLAASEAALRHDIERHIHIANKHLNRAEQAEAALRIIAGHEQCIDNLMSDSDVARAALAMLNAKNAPPPAEPSDEAIQNERFRGDFPLTA